MSEAAIKQQHPHYQQFAPVWQLLGEVYEGDGGFLDGSHLVAHPRELTYTADAEGRQILDSFGVPTVLGETIKYRRRKALARYENFAQVIVDTFVAHQYAKRPSRTFHGAGSTELEDWWQDVDGFGTYIDDWMRDSQALVNTYGHIAVVMDRPKLDTPATSKAQEVRPVLRRYIPLDVWDWLAPNGHLQAIKVVEAVERTDLLTARPVKTRVAGGPDPALDVEFRVWTDKGWRLFSDDGKEKEQGDHAYGEVPVVVWYRKRRGRIPLVGRSLLGDPKQYKDHYNMISEQRALFRDQTFSMLNIPLGEDEQVADARGRLGVHAGTDSLIFTKGGMGQFIAPPDGPVVQYADAILALERKIYRSVGLPWEGDSRDAESADSRRIKHQDLNRILADMADEAERFEYAIARLWFLQAGSGSREARLDAYAAAKLTIRHPDEFQAEEIQQTVDDARAVLSLFEGVPSVQETIRVRALPVLVQDLTPEEMDEAVEEIKTATVEQQERRQTLRERLAGELSRGEIGQRVEAGLGETEEAA